MSQINNDETNDIILENEKDIKQLLVDGEEIEAIVPGTIKNKLMGQDSHKEGAMIATNQRLISYGDRKLGRDVKEINYNEITSLDLSSQSRGVMLTLETTDNVIEFTYDTQSDGNKLIDTIKKYIN